jgi:hypothetical protein
MRPFRFFFALSLGLFFLFFIARFVVMALIVAAVMSTIFFVFRQLRHFFMGMQWEDRRYAYYNRYERPNQLTKQYFEDDLFWSRQERPAERLVDYRSIEVR